MNSGGVSAGGTVNVDLSTRWKLSVIGSYAHSESDTRADNGYDVTMLQDALDAGTAGVDPYGTLSPALLGNMIVNRAKSNSDTGSASMLVSGKVLPLPAGDLGVSLKLGAISPHSPPRACGTAWRAAAMPIAPTAARA
ncbi:hypothetical protein ACFSLT_27895 [Novosphingobium resinovorum]